MKGGEDALGAANPNQSDNHDAVGSIFQWLGTAGFRVIGKLCEHVLKGPAVTPNNLEEIWNRLG